MENPGEDKKIERILREAGKNRRPADPEQVAALRKMFQELEAYFQRKDAGQLTPEDQRNEALAEELMKKLNLKGFGRDTGDVGKC